MQHEQSRQRASCDSAGAGVGAVINTAQIRPGSSVAIAGLGSVCLAVLGSAGRIVAIDEKHGLARQLDVTNTVNAKDADHVQPGARPHQRRRRLRLRSCRHDQGNGDGVPSDAMGQHHGDRRPVADCHRILVQAERASERGNTIKGSYLGSCVPVRDISRFIAVYQQGKLPVDRVMSQRIGFDQLNGGFDRLQDIATVRQALVPHG